MEVVAVGCPSSPIFMAIAIVETPRAVEVAGRVLRQNLPHICYYHWFC